MTRRGIFIFVVVAMIVNLVLLLITQTGIKNIKAAKLSWWIIIDAIIVVGLAAIPGVNILALVIAVGILFYTIWINGLPILTEFIGIQKGDKKQ